MADLLSGIQERYSEYESEERLKYLDEKLSHGAATAHNRAQVKLKAVYDAVGFVDSLIIREV